MARLFVAADLPDNARDHLLALRPAPLPGMRLVPRGELHLTLHFLGEVEDGYVPALAAALGKVKPPPLTIDLEGVGRFPEEGPTRVLWAGVRASPSLSALHRAVGAALAAAVGFVPEERPYRPHVTLAWLGTPPPQDAIEDFLDEHAAFWLEAVPVPSFSLFSSTQAGSGPLYDALATFALQG